MIDETNDTIDRRRADQGRMDKVPRIVIFSPDMDFCMSLRMLYQDRFDMACTTDPDMLVGMVKTLQPQVVIADCLLTPRMRHRFGVIHRQDPGVKIIYFYFSPYADRSLKEFIRISGDVAFSKPIDLDEVTRTINALVADDLSASNSHSHA